MTKWDIDRESNFYLQSVKDTLNIKFMTTFNANDMAKLNGTRVTYKGKIRKNGKNNLILTSYLNKTVTNIFLPYEGGRPGLLDLYGTYILTFEI
jgi:hypothetical protein